MITRKTAMLLRVISSHSTKKAPIESSELMFMLSDKYPKIRQPNAYQILKRAINSGYVSKSPNPDGPGSVYGMTTSGREAFNDFMKDFK